MSKRKFFATPYLVWILGFTILPLVMIFWYAFGNGSGGFTIENVLAIFDGVHRKALVTSLVLFLPRIRHLLMWDQRLYDLSMLILDSLGLGIFTVVGIRIAWRSTAEPTLFLLVFVGVVTGVGGGVLRDVMAGDTPYIFVKHIYACASLAGALVCTVLWRPAGEVAAILAGAGVVVLIRFLSAHYRWNLPRARD